MQLFILLYIEGGSYIQEEEETWEFVVLYVMRSSWLSDAVTRHLWLHLEDTRNGHDVQTPTL